MVTAYSFAWNFTDLIWLKRWNIMLGVSDKVFILTEEVLAPILVKFAEKRCSAQHMLSSYHVSTNFSFATLTLSLLLSQDKFLSMPMFIIVAALAPEGVEVTMVSSQI